MKPFDANGAFRPATGGLRRLAIRGTAASLFSSGMGLAIQVIATVVLARLLAPADFGLVTMATTFSLLLANFGSSGFTHAIIQREEIDHALASNLFWINLAASFLLMVGFAGAGSLLARLFGNPKVENVAIGISVTILLNSTWVVHTALLQRAMRFSVISINDIIARGMSVAVSIVLGLHGWGYWALVGGAIAIPLTTSIGAWILCPWMPGLPRRVPGTGERVRFATSVYGRFTINYFSRNVDNLLVGLRFNAEALGFYKKAYDLFALSSIMQSLTSVAVSALSRLKADRERYGRYFLTALSVAAFFGLGIGADLTLIGKDLIRLLMGPGWEESGRIFTFFGPGFGAMFIYGTHGWIHLSIGKPERWFRWGIIEFVFTSLLFVLALPWGPVGVAVAWTASLWILTIPGLWYAGQPIRFPIMPVIAVVWRYVAAALLAGCASAVMISKFPSFAAASDSVGVLIRMLVISAVFGALYLGAVILLHGGLAPLHQVAGLLRDVIPAKFLKPSQPIASTPNDAALTEKVGAVAVMHNMKDNL